MALTKEDYLKRVKEINPHIQIVSEFKGVANPIQYICPICHEVKEVKKAQYLYQYKINSCKDCKEISEEDYLIGSSQNFMKLRSHLVNR